jgi:hypothetical protein
MTTHPALLILIPWLIPFAVLAMHMACTALRNLRVRTFKVGGLTFVQVGRFSASFCVRRRLDNGMHVGYIR